MKDEPKRRSFSSIVFHPLSLLSRHWFLALLLLGIGLAWFRPDWLQPWSASTEPRVVVGLGLFLIAISLPSGHLLRSLLRPLPPILALLVSYGALPLLGWLVTTLLPDADM